MQGHPHHPVQGWTCFHCNENFTSHESARAHFEATPAGVPGCRVDQRETEVMWRGLAAGYQQMWHAGASPEMLAVLCGQPEFFELRTFSYAKPDSELAGDAVVHHSAHQVSFVLGGAITDYVDCPVCGEGGMRRETTTEGSTIHCSNLGCKSNGGGNATTILQQASYALDRMWDTPSVMRFIVEDAVARGRTGVKQVDDTLNALMRMQKSLGGEGNPFPHFDTIKHLLALPRFNPSDDGEMAPCPPAEYGLQPEYEYVRLIDIENLRSVSGQVSSQ